MKLYKSGFPYPHTALNITKRCNQRCVFCFEGSRRDWDEPTLDEVKERLRRIAVWEKRVIFMGAEALLRRDIVEVVGYARSLGLQTAAFTNGQAFTRADFLEELAQAGLTDYQLSAHYSDAESFALGTRTSPRFFERYCRGLENVAAHNKRMPDLRLRIAPKTLLFRYNAGRLMDIKHLLRGLLGDAFVGYMISSVNSTVSATAESLLEPLAQRRAELADFMQRWEHDIDLWFSMVPLCLIPGWEHYSYDARMIAGDVRVKSNFEDKDQVGDMHDYFNYYRENPYRWVCRDCGFLPLCPAARCSWKHESFLPTPDQKFIPSGARAADAVLRKILTHDALPDAEQVRRSIRARGDRLRRLPLPEHALRRALASLPAKGPVVESLTCDRVPIFRVVLRSAGRRVMLHLSHPRPNESVGHLVQYLAVRFEAHDTDEAARRAALRALARLALPKLSDWDRYPGFDMPSARTAERLWELFGPSLWPGPARFGRWSVTGMDVTKDSALRLHVSSPDGFLVELFFLGANGPTGPFSDRTFFELFSISDLKIALAYRLSLPESVLEAAALGELAAALLKTLTRKNEKPRASAFALALMRRPLLPVFSAAADALRRKRGLRARSLRTDSPLYFELELVDVDGPFTARLSHAGDGRALVARVTGQDGDAGIHRRIYEPILRRLLG